MTSLASWIHGFLVGLRALAAGARSGAPWTVWAICLVATFCVLRGAPSPPLYGGRGSGCVVRITEHPAPERALLGQVSASQEGTWLLPLGLVLLLAWSGLPATLGLSRRALWRGCTLGTLGALSLACVIQACWDLPFTALPPEFLPPRPVLQPTSLYLGLGLSLGIALGLAGGWIWFWFGQVCHPREGGGAQEALRAGLVASLPSALLWAILIKGEFVAWGVRSEHTADAGVLLALTWSAGALAVYALRAACGGRTR